MERHNIAPGFVEDALESVRVRGMDTAALMAKIGLPETVTEPVTNVEYGRLWWLIAETINDEFFGLAARPMRPGSFNLLCHAVLHAGTLERALRRALQFLNVVLDDPRGELRIRDGMAHVVLTDAGHPRPAFAYRAYWLILMGVVCWLIGRRIPLRTLDFACPAPVHRQDYHKFFGAPVLFDQPVTRLVFSSSYLSLPIIRSDVALDSFLREAPANILIRYRHDNDLSARVRAQLNALPITDWPSFEELAKGLGMSVPTLRRRLRGEGQSFGTIKDELRFVIAERLLQESRLSVAEVAAELGYSEPSAFYRAFHKWMGQSPGRFRTIQQEE
ncbi:MULTISPECIES: AraC family transcriptional regulator [Brucella/Ochrobactrum group]|uniref:Helix-turn-helix-domain containing protein AraC type n=1 Tax=Brucella anthropi (strain ATCC 49188 / DSM 6882 / CCUG 24695 / JCM 21032 / LMG 3331 / NBRC 15819 / NCTC 12168 / Alc 37) TaxID=439375 RepID=A6X3L4_BRUA4|nr:MULTISPECIES: AraC family transcriptional regulator [Brucella/Ochrobactrum group]ABS15818.1 helix-turn-helix- domain containing protein AraC type [Brucella anthropi ATCC 49188]AIK41849.1 helix-turn-helix domain protein [Brucella anthropi]KAB2735423.1 AraC family transcriptional regulator [Brucella anthropi]KAB2751258.1 AraC family transcriptional regulator [Brucella anthropi]KAB2757441.1 AraC family transcriptional regulator [Brucella anthropi]